MSKSKFSIVPPNGLQHFTSGLHGLSTQSFISGIVQLRYPPESPVRAKKITISLVGICTVTWKALPETNDFTVELPQKGEVAQKQPKPIRYSGQESLYSQSVELWQNKSSSGWEELTTLDLPFKFTLSQELPESIAETPLGGIQYILQATMHRRSNVHALLPARAKQVEVLVPLKKYVLSTLPEYNTPVVFQSDPRWAQQRGCEYEVTVPRTCFGPGDAMEAYVRFHTDNPSVKLKHMEFGLKEYVEARNGDEHESKHKEKSYLQKTTIKTPQTLEKELWKTITMKRPERIRPSVDTKLLTITHQLKIKLVLEGEKDIRLESDVTCTSFTKDECMRVHEYLTNSNLPESVMKKVPPPTVVARQSDRKSLALVRDVPMLPPVELAPLLPPEPRARAPARAYSFDGMAGNRMSWSPPPVGYEPASYEVYNNNRRMSYYAGSEGYASDNDRPLSWYGGGRMDMPNPLLAQQQMLAFLMANGMDKTASIKDDKSAIRSSSPEPIDTEKEKVESVAKEMVAPPTKETKEPTPAKVTKDEVKAVKPTVKEVTPSVKETTPAADEPTPKAASRPTTAKETPPNTKETKPAVKEATSDTKETKPDTKETKVDSKHDARRTVESKLERRITAGSNKTDKSTETKQPVKLENPFKDLPQPASATRQQVKKVSPAIATITTIKKLGKMPPSPKDGS